MATNGENKVHKYLSNIFYYLFVVLILGLFSVALLVDEHVLIFDILFASLIVSSLVITFYFAVQMLRYNFEVRKSAQLGVFLIVIGFLLILTSLSKFITFGEQFLLSILGETFFVYWGIVSVIVGFIIELTLFDQLIWKYLIIKPAKFIYNLIKSMIEWLRRQWKNITLYTLDFASLGAIIFVAITWEILWWKLLILSLACIYPIVHHHKSIWRGLRYVFVDIIYRFFYRTFLLAKKLASFVKNSLVNFSNFVKKHWFSILMEFLRLLGVAAGAVLIYFEITQLHIGYLVLVGIAIILFSEFLTRGIIISFLKRITIRFGRFLKAVFARIWYVIKEITLGILRGIKTLSIRFWNFIKTNYKRILLEIGRLVLAVGGAALIYLGVVDDAYWYLIYVGISMIILFEIILRRIVLRQIQRLIRGIWRGIKNIGRAFWETLKWLAKPIRFIGLKIYAGLKFLARNWVKVVLYILDISALTSIVITIYFTITLQFYWWYIIILSASGLYIVIHHSRSIWRFLKFIGTRLFYHPLVKIANYFKRIFIEIGQFVRTYWKSVLKEFVRLIFVAAGICMIYFGNQMIPEILGLILFYAGIAIIPISLVFSRIAVLKFLWNLIKSFFTFWWDLIVRYFKWNVKILKIIGKFFVKYSVLILRVLGLVSVIYGVVVSFSIGWNDLITILTVSIGGFFLIFAGAIIYPRKFWRTLKSIPKKIWNVFVTIWLTIKYAGNYIITNFLRILLLLTMLFAFIYGATLISSFNFLPIFTDDPYITRLSVGGGLVIVAIGSFILLRRELMKLRSGQSKKWLQEVKERWKK